MTNNNIDRYITKNYSQLKEIVRRITKNDTDYEEVFHNVLEQLLKKRDQNLTDTDIIKLFKHITQINYYSKESPYQRLKHITRKHNAFDYIEDMKDFDLPDEDPDTYHIELQNDIDWLYDKLNELDWFDKKLFDFYFTGNGGKKLTYQKISDITTISIGTICNSIKRTKEFLINEYKKEKK